MRTWSTLGAWRGSAAAENTCQADCDGSGTVGANEIIRCVNVAMGEAPLDACLSCDANGDTSVDISELVAAGASAAAILGERVRGAMKR